MLISCDYHVNIVLISCEYHVEITSTYRVFNTPSSVRYNWEMDQRIYSPSGGKVAIIPGVGTLHFNNPQLKDQGWYQCFAKNSGGVGATDKVFLRAAS